MKQEVRQTTTDDRERKIYRVTIAGGLVNVFLLLFKFTAGILGHSAAMIADAVHSLSDFLTDIVVLIFVHLSNKPSDKDHDYGHGKYETLATAFIGMALLAVGLMICYNGLLETWQALNGKVLPHPGWIAFVAALLSIGLKEWAYQFTMRVGQKCQSEAVKANAWHHRSDALSSIGTAAIVVSFFIVRAALSLLRNAFNELMEASLPEKMEDEIVEIAEEEPEVSEVHNLRTRRIGNNIAVDMHIRMPGSISLYEAHLHASNIEHRLREHFGRGTYVALHLEPLKVNGQYVKPSE